MTEQRYPPFIEHMFDEGRCCDGPRRRTPGCSRVVRMVSEPTVGQVAQGRAAARAAVVLDALVEALGEPGQVVVDIGGGTGVSAVRLAAAGHRVTVIDPSPDALAALARRAREAGVEHLLEAHQGDVQDIGTHVRPGGADLVLCHGVLELVDDPADALARIVEVVRPGGHVSLLAAQRHAAVLARAMAGQFVAARELLDDPRPQGRAGRRFAEAELATLLREAGLRLERIQGIRVFTDLVPGVVLDAEPGSAAALVELERVVAERAEFRPLATQLHLLASR